MSKASTEGIFNAPHEHGNVVLNLRGRPIEDLQAFAFGYAKAAHTLATQLIAAPGYGDYEGYPILFLYRHSLELYLKAMVYRGAKLLRLVSQETVNTDKLFGNHNLARLLPAVRAISKQMKWTFKGAGLDSYEEFGAIVQKLDSVDPGSYTFRYPINKSGQANMPHHFVVNVPLFAEQMDSLLQFLDGAVCQIDDRWQVEAETRYELERLANGM
jgi:hypothetical protein